MDFPEIYIDPVDLPGTGFDVTMNAVGASDDALTIVKFTTGVKIPKSYAHVVNNVQQDMGRIRVSLKTHESFVADLASGYMTGADFPC
jgi:hypothetical protein